MKNLFIIFLLFIILSGCNNNSHFVINGQMGGHDDEKVYLAKYVNNDFLLTDSALLNKGKFLFVGNQETPELFYILNSKKTSFKGFFLENGEINVTGHPDSLWNAKVSGSISQDEYDRFYSDLEEIRTKLSLSNIKMDSVRKSNNKELFEIYKRTFDSVRMSYFKFMSDYIDAHPGSSVSIEIIMDNYPSLSPERLESWINRLEPSLKETERVTMLFHILETMKKVAIGQPAQDFIQNDTTGEPIKLSSFYGKYLLLDFWASWCGPCRDENPNLVAVYKRFHNTGFNIVGISLDEDREKWLAAIKDDNLTWTQISDLKGAKNEAAHLYGVVVIPDNFLLDKDGKIIARRLRGEKLTNKLEEILGK